MSVAETETLQEMGVAVYKQKYLKPRGESLGVFCGENLGRKLNFTLFLFLILTFLFFCHFF